jgi:hypothetical protein
MDWQSRLVRLAQSLTGGLHIRGFMGSKLQHIKAPGESMEGEKTSTNPL